MKREISPETAAEILFVLSNLPYVTVNNRSYIEMYEITSRLDKIRKALRGHPILKKTMLELCRR